MPSSCARCLLEPGIERATLLTIAVELVQLTASGKSRKEQAYWLLGPAACRERTSIGHLATSHHPDVLHISNAQHQILVHQALLGIHCSKHALQQQSLHDHAEPAQEPAGLVSPLSQVAQHHQHLRRRLGG